MVMAYRWAIAIAGLLALLATACANITEDRIAARTACYKDCMSSQGWDPVCAWNPAYPKETTHGGGSQVWPNECSIKCMSQYAKYAEWRNLQVRYRVKMPERCYLKAWSIYFGLQIDDAACKKCPRRPSKPLKAPAYRGLTEEECTLACFDRDGWKPVCVQDFTTRKKVAFGNACAAQCSTKIISPTPLYNTKLGSACKTLFSLGKWSASCSKCPAGKTNPNLFIDNDRVVAREYCYKACISRDGWDPVCMWNPAYPKETPKGGGKSVWPNECTGKCMSQYAKYAEYFNLVVIKKESKPQKCADRVYDIWYLDSSSPTAPESLIKTCTTCSASG